MTVNGHEVTFGVPQGQLLHRRPGDARWHAIFSFRTTPSSQNAIENYQRKNLHLGSTSSLVGWRGISGSYSGPKAYLCHSREENFGQVRHAHQNAINRRLHLKEKSKLHTPLQIVVHAIDDVRFSCLVRLRRYPPEKKNRWNKTDYWKLYSTRNRSTPLEMSISSWADWCSLFFQLKFH